jgi:alpha-tubulin suppressor-like RCC1 family protein
MTRLLPLPLLCACAGSLVDHSGATLPGGATPACVASCTSTSVPGADPVCIGDTCSYECRGGKLKCANGCCDTDTISAGASHTCAVVAAVAGGEARCWGANDQGQLGGAGASSYVPVKADVTGSVTAIAAGAAHTCAIAGGEVWCWGDNTYGQLGLGSMGGSAAPQKVRNLSGASRLAAGSWHTCAANATKMFCWGRNDLGQVGNDFNAHLTPTEVVGVSGPIAIAAGESHTCAVAGSTVLCWGQNSSGQLGNGTAGSSSSTPAPVSPALAATFLGLGAKHSCAGTASGDLYCWGANASQQVGVSGATQTSPQKVMSNVDAVVAGFAHTCALTTSQTMRCWGLNDRGQLSSTQSDEGHVDVWLPPGGAQAAAAGSRHTCAVANGSALCWGSNSSGQLGTDPATTPSTGIPTPTTVSGR